VLQTDSDGATLADARDGSASAQTRAPPFHDARGNQSVQAGVRRLAGFFDG